MKKIYQSRNWIVPVLVVISLPVFSQAPTGAPAGRRAGFGNGQAPSIGHFYGKVVDLKTGKGIDGVSVQLIRSRFDTATHKNKDVAIAGMITGKKGDFSLTNLP